MPKTAARSRRSIATVASTAVISASVAVLLLPVTAPPAGAAAAPGSTQRASLRSPDNTASDRGGQDSVLSGNGESVAFTSTSKLDPSLDVGSGESVPYQNIFVRDLVKNRTVMISRGQFTPPPPPSSGGDGPGVVRFGSQKLLALQPGAVPKDTPPNGDSFTPSISADGRFVAFETWATNIVDVGAVRWSTEIVICDRDPDGDGVYDENRADNGSRDYKYYRVTNGNDSPSLPKIAANASRIVWEASNDGSFLLTRTLNLAAGTLGEQEEVPGDISTGPNDNPSLRFQTDPAISGDGNHIVWQGRYQPRCDCGEVNALVSTDMRTKQATRVDLDPAPGPGPNDFGKPISTADLEMVHHPAINGDGTVIAFVADQFTWHSEQPADSLFNEPTTYLVHVDYSRAPGKRVLDSQIVSRDNNFTIINGDRPALSNDGRYLAFVTNNLNAHDGNDGQQTDGDCIKPPAPPVVKAQRGPALQLNTLPPRRNAPHTTCQVVMRDLLVDHDRLINELPRLKGTLVSGNRDGNAGNGNTVPDIIVTRDPHDSSAPSLSSDGGRVAYDSDATDLVAQPADNNQRTDVFVRTLEPTVQGDALNFGNVQIGTTTTRTVRLNEVGFGPLTVDQLSITGTNAGDFALGGQTCTGQTIHETGFCEVSVQFSPKAEGARTAQLLVQIRGARRSTVNLTGTGTPVPPTPPQFAAGPNPLSFGNRLLLSDGPTAAVTVSNGGQAPLQITAVDIVGPGNPEDYRVASSTCAAPVPGGGQCVVNIAFSPKGSGNRGAVLRFTDNVPGGPHLVGLQGSANQPTIAINPGITPPGRVVTVTGKDFPPGRVVTVKFQDRPGQATVKAKDDGTFQTPLLVFPKSSPETRTVLATGPDFTDPLGRTTLLVVLATVSPANFVVRG